MRYICQALWRRKAFGLDFAWSLLERAQNASLAKNPLGNATARFLDISSAVEVDEVGFHQSPLRGADLGYARAPRTPR